MEMKQESLVRELIRFYLRLLIVGAIANAVVAAGGAVYLMAVDRPVSAAALSSMLFWFSVIALGWVAFMFTAKVSALGWGDAAVTRAQPRFQHLTEQQEARLRFAWYAGATGVTALLLAFLLPAF